MFRILWVYLSALIYVVFHIISIRKRYKHPEKYSIDERFKHLQKLANLIVKRSGCKVDVIGRENRLDEPVLYVANHPSMMDPYFISYAVQKQAGATIPGELWFDRIPIVAPWLKSVGTVFIDRENMRKGLQGINQAIENVKKGHSILLFPEGEVTGFISTHDKIADFHSGGLKIAIKAQVPIIPIVVKGTDKVYGAHEVIGKLKKGTVQIQLLKPYVKHLKEKMNNQEVAKDLRKRMLEVYNQITPSNK